MSYDAGHGSGLRHYARKHEFRQLAERPAVADLPDDGWAGREAKIREAIRIGFQVRRLPGEMGWARERLPAHEVGDE